MVKLVDYGSDSESEGENSQEIIISKQTPIDSTQVPVGTKVNPEQNKGGEQTLKNQKDESEIETKKKVMLKYKDLPKFLNPAIHKQDNIDGWKPKSLAEIELERKRRAADLSENNEKKNKFVKVMRLPSPKLKIQNEEISNISFKKVQTGAVLPPSLNPESLFQEETNQSAVEQFDRDDLFISRKHQKIAEDGDKEGNDKYAQFREATQEEQDLMNRGNIDGNMKVQEVTREQLIGDSNWLLNHQKAQQKSVLREGLQLNQQVDKTQKSKNQLNFLAVEAISNSDLLDQERSEQIRNTMRKRQRYGW